MSCVCLEEPAAGEARSIWSTSDAWDAESTRSISAGSTSPAMEMIMKSMLATRGAHGSGGRCRRDARSRRQGALGGVDADRVEPRLGRLNADDRGEIALHIYNQHFDQLLGRWAVHLGTASAHYYLTVHHCTGDETDLLQVLIG